MVLSQNMVKHGKIEKRRFCRCLDKDDGSSNYEEVGNVLLYGAIKDRDGLWRLAHGNLLVFPELMPFEDTTDTKMAMACVHTAVEYSHSCCAIVDE